MANVLINSATMTDIADAIRSKKGVSTTYKPADMADAIGSISGGITPTGTKNISIATNGVTTEDVTNYASAQITANVPNSYSASDEGKVVSNGALVSQTSDSVTTNGTVDTTLINSLTVNVAGNDRNLIFGTNGVNINDNADVASKIAALNYVVKYEVFVGGTLFSATLKQSTLGSGKTYIIDLKGKSVLSGTNAFNANTNPLLKITCDDDPNVILNLNGTAQQVFRYCNVLEEIRPKLDFSAMTGNYNSTWLNSGGVALTYIRCVPNSLSYNFGFDNSSLLTDDSIVSIANALKDGITGHSIKFHATPKARCDSIMGTVSQVTESGVTYNLFTKSDSGTVSLTSFITQTKGWTLA